MPRVELTEEEHQIILRRREQERFYRAGKEEVLNELELFTSTEHTHNELITKIKEMKSKL